MKHLLSQKAFEMLVLIRIATAVLCEFLLFFLSLFCQAGGVTLRQVLVLPTYSPLAHHMFPFVLFHLYPSFMYFHRVLFEATRMFCLCIFSLCPPIALIGSKLHLLSRAPVCPLTAE